MYFESLKQLGVVLNINLITKKTYDRYDPKHPQYTEFIGKF